ncbi:MAG TPA: MFS transporter [Planctomycetota bacterium]|nr:MFS transporter [Planctomycetota bacterium]
MDGATAADAHGAPDDALEPVRRRGRRLAIAMQCGSCLAIAALQNGQVLLYLRALGIGSIGVMVLLALPSLIYALAVVPTAYCSDTFGLKRVGRIGAAFTAVGFSLLPVAAVVPAAWVGPTLIAGLAAYAIGTALFSSCWYVIVDPLVAPSARGRFWGRLRFSWQSTALVFGLACTLLVADSSPAWVLALVLAVVACGQWLRAVLYLGLPELVRSRVTPGGFARALAAAARTPGYLPFCAYVFLLTLFTAACPTLFALIEKESLQLSDNTVIWLGAALMTGSVAGAFAGGPAVDRFGMKSVFIVCHFAYGLILALFVARGLISDGPEWLAVLTFAFAAVGSAAGIAVSSEMLALLPAENRALAVSVLEMLRSCGVAASTLLSAAVLRSGMLRDAWSVGGLALSPYDAVLTGCATMVVLCVVALGLVPSVIGRPAAIERAVVA